MMTDREREIYETERQSRQRIRKVLDGMGDDPAMDYFTCKMGVDEQQELIRIMTEMLILSKAIAEGLPAGYWTNQSRNRLRKSAQCLQKALEVDRQLRQDPVVEG